MSYNRQTGWRKQAAFTVGTVLRATTADVAEFGGGACWLEYEQDVSPTGAEYLAAGQLPSAALILGVTARVLTAITGCTAWALGSGAMPTAWGSWIDVGEGSTTTSLAFLAGGLTPIGLTAQPALLTAIDGTFASGSVRLRTYYLVLEAP